MTDYELCIAAEKEKYENCTDVHRLPEIFHYWSHRHVRPKLLPFGFASPNDMFGKYAQEKFAHAPDRATRLLSLGSGNCDLEISLAVQMRERGYNGFILDCCDLNPAMLERGRIAAHEAGVADRLTFTAGDLNAWNPVNDYDVILANQSLHHILKLERLFDGIKSSLRPDGWFIISDMIGRNGHQRWPEALAVVQEFWRRLPPSYKFNRITNHYEEEYGDWDCSVEGFEGVRSQDILPLLLEQFHFKFFLPFANIVDPFVDRAFGHNFDADASWDRNFIDRVQRRDDEELASGRLKPTHMLAVVVKDPGIRPFYPGHLSPEFCVRPVDRVVATASPSPAPVMNGSERWPPWPHSLRGELQIACERLAQSGNEVKQRTLWALGLQRQLEERTAWALRLEEENAAALARAAQLDKDLLSRSQWALRLKEQVQYLEIELRERTAWALRLESERDEKASWALELRRELQQKSNHLALLEAQIRNPFRLAARLARGLANRVKRLLVTTL